jgi:hypothetical protein
MTQSNNETFALENLEALCHVGVSLCFVLYRLGGQKPNGDIQSLAFSLVVAFVYGVTKIGQVVSRNE